MEQYQYLLLMGACLLITLPLELVFGARVWRQPKRLAIALAPAFLLFVAWDLWASATGTWGLISTPSARQVRRATSGSWV